MPEIVEREHPVDVRELESCVRRYWEEANGDDERPLYRALTMNLIAVAPADDESLLRATFHRLLRGNPCIAFLVLLRGDARPLRASFGTLVEVGRNCRTVRLEQVTFWASPSERRRVPSLVRPLLVDDLPTQMFWSGGLTDDLRLLRELGGLANQIVYDSSLFADPDRDRARIAELGMPAVDLVWLRLAPWRHTLAEAFEAIDWRDDLPVRAVVRFAGTAGTRAAGVVLGRWLETRLGATVELVAIPRANAPSFEPCGVEISVGDARIAIDHCWPSPTLRAATTLADRCLLPFTAVSRCATRGDLLAAAAESLGSVRPRAGDRP